MLSTYRRVLAHPGTLRFSATALVARLPIAMISLGVVLLVSQARGSYGLAGAVSAVFLLANALVAILLGRLVDTFGQWRVLPAAATLCTAALVLLMVSVQADWPLFWTFGAAALAGLSLPPVGACVRARWSFVLDQPAQVQTAYALEGVLDEAVFILGPILVTVLATSLHPLAGLGTAAVTGLLGTLAFAAQRATAPPPHPRRAASGPRPGIPWRTIAPLTVVCLMLGAFFGSAEVATVAFADELGVKRYAGVLLGLWAFGSLSAGLVTGALAWRIGADERVRRGTLALTLVMLPMTLIGSAVLMGAALFLAGFAIAPTLIATLTLTEQTVPGPRLTEGIAVIHTGIVAGVAPGATLAGIVIDTQGASPAYLVAVGAGLLGAVAAQALPRRGARRPRYA
jgi:predicted MFS family arabinose efflux permease